MEREGWKQSEAWWHLQAFRKTKEFSVKEVYSKGRESQPFAKVPD